MIPLAAKPLLLASAFAICAACDNELLPDRVAAPATSPARSFGAVSLPPVLRGAGFDLATVQLRGDGQIDVPPAPLCDAARAVLGGALSLDYSCAGNGTVSLSHRSPDLISLLALFTATVERIGGTVTYGPGGSVAVVGPLDDREGFGVEGFEGADFDALDLEPVEGLDAFTLPAVTEFDSFVRAQSYYRRGDAIRVPSRISEDEARAAAAAVGLDADVFSLAGSRFIAGPPEQVDAMRALWDSSRPAFVTVPMPYLSAPAVQALSASYVGASIVPDAAASAVHVSGPADLVADVVRELSQTRQATSRVSIRGLFFSYENDSLARLETDLRVGARPVGLSSRDVAVSSTGGLVAAPFTFIVDAVESASFADVVSKPAVTATFGRLARFQSGRDVPIVQGVDPETGAELTSYRSTGLLTTFDVVPIGSRLLRVTVQIEISSVDGSGVRDNPSFSTRSITTSVDLARGDTVLLSGLTQDERSSSRGRAGFLLPSSAGRNQSRSLGLFLTVQ